MTAPAPASDQLVLHSYSRGRRHPMMIGLRVVGVRVALLASPTQILVFLATAVPLWLTWSLWAHLGGAGNALVMVGLPLGASFAARALKVEGRSPIRAASGVLALMMSPASGRRAGKASSRSRPRRRTVSYYLDPMPTSAATTRPPADATEPAAATATASEAVTAPIQLPTTPTTAPTTSAASAAPRPRRAPAVTAAQSVVSAAPRVPVSELVAAARALQAGAFRGACELEEAAR